MTLRALYTCGRDFTAKSRDLPYLERGTFKVQDSALPPRNRQCGPECSFKRLKERESLVGRVA